MEKFESDLKTAVTSRSDLKGFVFFTNVDLTPGEVDGLRRVAADRGITYVDIYWRERLRQLLDSPEGLGLRYQYLKINLSDAEQEAFFSRWSSQLEELITKQHRTVEDRLERIEFLQSIARRLTYFGLELQLKDSYAPVDIGDFGVVVALHEEPRSKDAWYIGGQSDYRLHKSDDSESLWFGHKTLFSSDVASGAMETFPARIFTPKVGTISFGVNFTNRRSLLTPECLDWWAC